MAKGTTSGLAALSSELAAAVEQAERSVVAIHARKRIPSSGVVWRPGVIVAAHHTIRKDQDITVTLDDGRSVAATLRGRDPGTDLAVLTFDESAAATSATQAQRSDAALAVGQLVLALGRPGRAVTASLGIISAVGGEWRTWHGGVIDQLVRLDLSVYDGFSGGALVDASGSVLGLTTSGLSRAAALAIPAATIDRVASQLLERGRVARGYIGVAMQPVRLRNDVGLLVVSLEPDGPADRAGLLVGDIVLALDDAPLSSVDDVLATLSSDRVGQTITARVLRGGERREVPITIGERP